tara:strand:- start:136 stop:516 length:381 start_codon:yes stop_codon:yes gene_type:complete
MTKTIDPRGTFTLSHDDFDRPEISMLIEKGLIEVVIDTAVKVSKKKTSKKKKTTKKVKKKKEEIDDFSECTEIFHPEPADETKEDINKEKTLINENKQTGESPVTISFPEVNEDGIIFVDNNNEVD